MYLFHRTYKCLLYSNLETFQHFRVLRDRYYSATHRDGVLCARNRHVLRRVTECLREDPSVRDKFVLLLDGDGFHSDDVDKVFIAYLNRVETMMGNEYAHQLMESLYFENENEGKLGSLRKLKRDRDEQSRGAGVKNEGDGASVNTKKRRRRKKKNW